MGKLRIDFTILPYILIYLLSIFLTGITDLINPQFTLARLGTSKFWYNIIMSNFANMSALIATVMLYITKVKAKDEDIQKKSKQIKDSNDNSIEGDFEDEYLAELNRKNKIKAYKDLIKDRIDRLKRKDIDLLEYNKYIKTKEEDRITPKNKYVLKRLALESFLNDEYINENLSHLKVDYEILKKSKIIHGYSANRQENKRYANSTKVIVTDLLPNYLFTLSLICFVASFGNPEFYKLGLYAVFTIVVKLISIIMNIASGRNYIQVYKKKVLLSDLDTSIDIIKDYLIWKINKNKVVKEN